MPNRCEIYLCIKNHPHSNPEAFLLTNEGQKEYPVRTRPGPAPGIRSNTWHLHAARSRPTGTMDSAKLHLRLRYGTRYKLSTPEGRKTAAVEGVGQDASHERREHDYAPTDICPVRARSNGRSP